MSQPRFQIGNVVLKLPDSPDATSNFIREIIATAPEIDPPKPITTCGVITHHRPKALERALRSYIDHAQKFDRTLKYVIADDSSDPQMIKANLEVAETLRREKSVTVAYVGRTQKEKYAKELSKVSGVPLATVEFALLNPLACPISPGANRNSMLFEALNERYYCGDDDTICTPMSFPKIPDRLVVGTIPYPINTWGFSTAELAKQFGVKSELDFFSIHEQCLGRAVATLVKERGTVQFGSQPPTISKKICTTRGRALVSWAGVVGDSGYKYPVYLLHLQGDARVAALKDQATFESMIQSRQVVRIPIGAILSDNGVYMGAATALDNTTVLPPFLPVLRGEDMAFGKVFSLALSEHFKAYHPTAIFHEPIDHRTHKTDAIWKATNEFPFHQVLTRLLEAAPTPPPSLELEHRYEIVGNSLKNFGNLAPEEFWNLIATKRSKTNREHREYLTSLLKHHNEQPSFWADETKRCIGVLESEEKKSARPLPTDLLEKSDSETVAQLSQEIVRNYGSLITAWPSIYKAALELKAKGICPSSL